MEGDFGLLSDSMRCGFGPAFNGGPTLCQWLQSKVWVLGWSLGLRIMSSRIRVWDSDRGFDCRIGADVKREMRRDRYGLIGWFSLGEPCQRECATVSAHREDVNEQFGGSEGDICSSLCRCISACDSVKKSQGLGARPRVLWCQGPVV